MGEAFLHNHGGATLNKLIVRTPPSKVIYYYNDPIDMSGSVIVAKIGSTELILSPGMYTYSPLVAEPGDTQITVSFTFGLRTLTASIPITVGSFDPVFSHNTWEAIAAAAALGVGKDFWNAGDEKTEIVNYSQRTFRILDFDHTDLSPTDEHYNDSSYNGGSNKAHITLQSVEKWGNAQFGYWPNQTTPTTWNMANTLQAVYETFPSLLKSIMRLVRIRRAIHLSSGSNTFAYTDVHLHLLAVSEMFPVTPQNAQQYDVFPHELDYYSQCAFYANKGTLIVGENWPSDYQGEWLTSTNITSSYNGEKTHHTYVNVNDQVVNEAIYSNSYEDYYPVFNI